MAMLLTDKGTAYSEGFFELDNGRVMNTFTNKSVGVFVRKIESNNYLVMGKPSLFKRIINWWRKGDAEAYIRVHRLSDEAVGTLADTFRQLEKDVKNER